jgi:glycosyltransferase involved in cell wall biosynthesis
MFFSIITVTFNNQNGLDKTFRSLETQKCSDYEWIIIDGASTDGTQEFVNRVITDDVKFISEPDKGIYDAQNKGIALASGKFLLFLNAGDTFENIFVLEKIKEVSNGNEDLLYGNIIIQEKENIKYPLLYPKNISYKYWYNQKYLCHQAVFFNKRVFEKYGIYDLKYRFSADYDLLQRIWFKKEINIKHVDWNIVVYDLEGVSAKEENRLIILNEYKKIRRTNHGLFKNIIFNILYGKLSIYTIFSYFRHILFILLKPFRSTIAILERIIIRADKKIYKNLKINKKNRPFILHLSTSDQHGGAAKAAFNIHQSLLDKNQNSLLIVAKSSADNPNVVKAKFKSGFRWLMDVIRNWKRNRMYKKAFSKNGVLHSYQNYSFLDIQLILDILKPDIVHFHWIGFNLLSIEDISLIKVPIVWTMHDMWPFSGAEHVCFDESYKTGYKEDDIYNLDVWKRKSNAYSKVKIYPVGVSRWISSVAKESLLFSKFSITTIPNILKTDIFYPREFESSRKYWRLNLTETILLFGSDYKDTNKGYFTIETLIKRFDEEGRKDLTFVIFGEVPIEYKTKNLKLINIGHLKSTEDLAILYTASDITLVPSRIESFCLTAAESISCGTPVISFDTSGLQDIVMNDQTGYRCICFDENDFKSKVEQIIRELDESKFKPEKLHQFCIDNFSSEKISSKYIEFYSSLYNFNSL